ncbi:MAG: hypothetical protein AAB447_03675 [Patescibacteria group bacterium]
MAEKEGPIHDAVAHVKWFFFALAVLIFLWFYTGGYQRNQTNSNPLLIPPTALGMTGRTGTTDVDRVGFFKFIPSTVNLTPDAASYSTDPVESTYNNPNTVDTKSSGQIYTIKQTDVAVKSGIETSKYVKEISIENYSSPGSTKPSEEYVTIRASAGNTKKIVLTGWKLKSGVYGQSVEIGSGVYLPQLGSINTEQPIELSPGGRAIVVTGRSAIGVSFRENLCTGYFEQYQDFRPALSFNCPMIRDEDIPADPHGFNNYCLDTLDRIPRCQVFTAFTTALTPECQRYIVNYNNYPGCLNLHKNEPNFYSTTWRVFLGQDKSIWHTKREIIELIDPSGKIVDTVSF